MSLHDKMKNLEKELSNLKEENAKLNMDLKTAQASAKHEISLKIFQEKKNQELEAILSSIKIENAELHLQIEALENALPRNVLQGQCDRLEKEESGHIQKILTEKAAHKNEIKKLENLINRLQESHIDEIHKLKSSLEQTSKLLEVALNKTEATKMEETNPQWKIEAANAVELLQKGDLCSVKGEFSSASEFYKLGLEDLFKAYEDEKNEYFRDQMDCLLIQYTEKARRTLTKIGKETQELSMKENENCEGKKQLPRKNEDCEPKKPLPRKNEKLHLQFKIENGSTGHGFNEIFSPYLDERVIEITMQETYLLVPYQIFNLLNFFEVVYLKCPNLKRIKLITIRNCEETGKRVQLEMLSEIGSALAEKGIHLSVMYNQEIHDRYVVINNSLRILIGKGIQYFKNPLASLYLGKYNSVLRQCVETFVTIFTIEEEIQTGH